MRFPTITCQHQCLEGERDPGEGLGGAAKEGEEEERTADQRRIEAARDGGFFAMDFAMEKWVGTGGLGRGFPYVG